MKNVLLIILIVVAAGCSSVNTAIRNYHQNAGRVKVGDSKERVLDVLQQVQQMLPYDEMKTPDVYQEGGDLVEIYYFRSGHQPDNLTTDDEFTPYIFRNGKLTAIGWHTLGGPKTIGQVVPSAPVTNIEHNVTVEKD